MSKEVSFMYDNFSDRLFISFKKKSEKIKGSMRFLNLIIDFTTKNRLANVELRKASEYLNSLGINSNLLDNLTSVKISFKQCRDGYLLYFILQAGDLIERIPYNVFSSHPIPIKN